MKRSISLFFGLVLFVGAGSVLARNGGGHFGGAHWGGGRPVVGVHPAPVFRRPGPVVIGRPAFHHRHPVARGMIVVAPFFYPYPYYTPPVYAAPVYTEPPAYIEQGANVLYYCPDYRDYYPNVASCPSPWMQVLPGGTGAYPN